MRDIKEEMLYVSEEPVDERNLDAIRNVQYELPDGQIVTFGGERISVAEKMFVNSETL